MHILQSRRVLLPVHYPSYPNGRGLSSISWSVFTKKIFKISKILYHFGRAVHFSWPKCHKKKPKIGRILPLRRADRGNCVRKGKEGLGRVHKLPAAGLKLAKSRRAPPPRRASFGGASPAFRRGSRRRWRRLAGRRRPCGLERFYKYGSLLPAAAQYLPDIAPDPADRFYRHALAGRVDLQQLRADGNAIKAR